MIELENQQQYCACPIAQMDNFKAPPLEIKETDPLSRLHWCAVCNLPIREHKAARVIMYKRKQAAEMFIQWYNTKQIPHTEKAKESYKRFTDFLAQYNKAMRKF